MLNLHIRVTLSLEDDFIRLFKLITCEIAVYYNFIITGSKCKTAGQSFAEKRGSKEKRKFSGFGDGGAAAHSGPSMAGSLHQSVMAQQKSHCSRSEDP